MTHCPSGGGVGGNASSSGLVDGFSAGACPAGSGQAAGTAKAAGFDQVACSAEATCSGQTAGSAEATVSSQMAGLGHDASAPFFSIVMPMYGSEAYIADAIFDVQNQVFPDWELIVVDDASPDGSRSIVERFAAADPRIRLETHAQNRGLSAARNTGLAAARGAYVWFPDPDDRYDFTLLQSVRNSLVQHEAPVVMFGHVDEFYVAGKTAGSKSAVGCSGKAGEPAGAPDCGLGETAGDEGTLPGSEGAPAKLAGKKPAASAEPPAGASPSPMRTPSSPAGASVPALAFANSIDYPLETHHYGRAKLRSHVLGFEKGTHYGYAWNKVYQRSYLQEGGFQFVEGLPLIEDIEFNIRVFQDLPALNVVGEMLYRYAKREQANLTNKFVPRYYEVHRMRIELLRNQLESWGLLNDTAKATLGSLYARYILSALERNRQKESGMSASQQREWLQAVFADPLFEELIPLAQADSRALSICLKPLQQRNAAKCLALGSIIHTAKNGALRNVFQKLKAGR